MGVYNTKQSNMLSMIRAIFILAMVATIITACSDPESPGGPFIGKSGSLARFAVNSNYLYSVDDEHLNVFQIMENGALEKVNSKSLESGVETIHTQDQWLYIGTNSAMIIYDISNPSNPEYVSVYSHFVACDPVVVQDTLAYVTMRADNCRDFGNNTLDIINIKNSQSPTIVGTYILESPYGLAIDNNLLFVCEGSNGLKIFDVSNPNSALLLQAYHNITAYDAIASDGNLIVTGSNGVVQYDYTDQQAIRLLSNIPVSQ